MSTTSPINGLSEANALLNALTDNVNPNNKKTTAVLAGKVVQLAEAELDLNTELQRLAEKAPAPNQSEIDALKDATDKDRHILTKATRLHNKHKGEEEEEVEAPRYNRCQMFTSLFVGVLLGAYGLTGARMASEVPLNVAQVVAARNNYTCAPNNATFGNTTFAEAFAAYQNATLAPNTFTGNGTK